ncbi:MAG: SUMF1/EgtB/PvdO family nonheme iron enzyme, partial [Candidatus Competibacteraceae bacterium]|nr:SUMF1/EgtB/PvdO family nonheme iron enzyme [Candidatus Competibacteraceae bacterium]
NYKGTYEYGEPDCGATGVFRGKSLPVGSFTASPWKLYDTIGNVLEWTCSAYQKSYDGSEEQRASNNHTGLLAVRGGSWNTFYPAGVRSADRSRNVPTYRHYFLGFRLSRSL